MRVSIKKVLLLLLVIVLLAAFCYVKNQGKIENYQSKYEGYDLSVDVEGINRENTYNKYIAVYADASYITEDVELDICNYIHGEDVEILYDYRNEEKALYTGDASIVSWNADVPQAGFYNVYIEYMTVESRGVDIERILYINGKVPFSGSDTLTFSRQWTDGGDTIVDNQGNEIRPAQIEVYDWQSAYCHDDMGYIVEPYRFYFEKGSNTITLEAVNEPMVIRRMVLKAVENNVTYASYLLNQPEAEESEAAKKYYTKLQGEASIVRSDPSLYAKYDRSSPSTEPYSVTNTVLNYSGGEVWNSPGQWIEWEFEVPEDGFYHITIKGRQNYARGSVSCRTLYIDGAIPFEEVSAIEFEYNSDWNMLTLSDEDGKAYQFYLKAGRHTIKLEATLGDIGAILEELEDSTFRLNQIYRKILVYTGAAPDKYRDYNINQVYPEVIEAMSLEAKRLYKIVDDTVAYTGQKAEKIATAQTIAVQLEKFVNNPSKITVNFTTFKDNITSLGTAILNMSETKLDIDYIIVSGTEAEIPDVRSSVFTKICHEVRSFSASFYVDYDSVGDVYEEGEGIIKVWIVTGRDQGSILKTMVDDTFTPESGIKVNVEIVDAGALLSAVVAGRGPDVVLSIGADQPVNYALRNAVEDLTQFDDWEEVYDVFYDSAYRAYEYEGGIYAIPETQIYNLLFYREDILEELGLDIPQTWEELIDILPTIQGNSMSVAIPSVAGIPITVGAPVLPDLSCYYAMVYQNGSDIYDDTGMTTIIDNEAGVDAFCAYTKFFTDYGMPTIYDFVSRFRSGEMPIGIANYTLYNTLIVSAPEIRGLWDFTLIPGAVKTDENGEKYIDRSVYSTGTCSMMIKTEDKLTLNNAWEFMKWWAQTDTQVRFGREIEALLGASARYATANREAFDQLAWSAADVAVLEEQWKWVVGFREVAGGYYTPRHITNAVRKVITDKDDPRETILDYAITIDQELIKKRAEFGLDTK